MSKMQLLYEKLMKISFIFAGLFFVGFLIDLFFAMSEGVITCNDTFLCSVEEGNIVYSATLYPLLVGLFIFLIAGRVFYALVNKESKLLSVDEYRKQMEEEERRNQPFSRDRLDDRLRVGESMRPKVEKSTFEIIKTNVSDFGGWFVDLYRYISDFTKDKLEARKSKVAQRKQASAEMKKVEKEGKIEKTALENRDKKLTKTKLALRLSEECNLDANNAREFLNSFFTVVKDTVADDDQIQLNGFGKFLLVDYDGERTFEYIPSPTFLEEFVDETTETEITEDVISNQEPIKEPQKETVEEPKEESIKETPEVTQEKTEKTEDIEEIKEKSEEKPKEKVKEKLEDEPKEKVEEEVKETKSPDIATVEKEKEKEKLPKEENKPKPAPKKKPKKKKVTKTKKHIIELLSENTDLSKNKSNNFLKFFADVVKDTLSDREDIEIPGFGVFTTIEMPAKEAVNPQTNEPIIVPAHHQVRLRFDDDFKDQMNEEE